MTQPLLGDADRQATAALRGYWYQILRSIYEWIDLSEGDRLYLEGAEDFDRLSGSEAQATQVKHSDTNATVTLRSPAAIAAINSYWDLRHRNSPRVVRLNLLTTAGIGMEAGEPFGVNRAGLDLWTDAAQTSSAVVDEEVVALTRFLVDEGRVSDELLQFLKTATPVEVRAQLLRPVAWRTREPGIGDVEAALLSRLRTICQQRGIPSTWAEKVRDRLVTAAWAAITHSSQDARVVTREDFDRQFLEVQTVTLQLAALPEYVANAISQGLASVIGSSGGAPLILAASGSRLTGAPPSSGGRIERTELQGRIVEVLRHSSFVELQGSTGLGKTTQAAAIAATLAPTPLQWANCRDIDQSQLRIVVDELSRRLQLAMPPLTYIVLDDLDVLEHLKVLEELLPGMLYALRQRAGGLILTNDRRIPQSLLAKLGVSAECIIAIPQFSDTEVQELLENAGLSDEVLRSVWARLIWAKTNGHPQLVTAHITTLARRGFPPPASDDIATVPPEIKDVRETVRLLLGRELPSGERELLYRLSAVAGSFERDRAVALAQWEPPIPQPGDVFDSLVGPWIERTSDTHYRLSALLGQAGQDANSEVWLRGMHSAIAWTWLRFPQQSPWDIATILVSATIAGDFDVIVRLGIGLFNASPEAWAALAGANLLFTHFYTQQGARFPGDAFQGFYLRWIQIQLATHGSPGALTDILDRVEEEFSQEERKPRLAVLGYMLRLQALMHGSEIMGVRPLIRLIEGIDRLSAAVVEEVHKVANSKQKQAERTIWDGQTTQMLGVFLVRKVSTVGALDEAIIAFDEMEPRLRARCLALFRESPDMGRQWSDAVWLTEYNKSEPQWQHVAQSLRRLYEKALLWQELTLAQAVASVLARMLRENLSDTEAALTLLSEVPSAGAGEHLVRDARAKILWQIGKLPEAISLWNEVLNQWPPDVTGNLVGFALAARNAGIAAAGLQEWAVAADFFVRAAAPGLETLDERFACGLVADAAHAAWRSGDFPHAIDLGERAIKALQNIPNTPEDLRSFYLHKSIGHLMTWMSGSRRRSESTLHEPAPGTCSNLDPPTKVKEYNPTPIAMTQCGLLRAAQEAGLPLQPFQSLINALRIAPYPLARVSLAQLLLDGGIEKGEVDRLVPDLVLFSLAKSDSDAQKSADIGQWLPYERPSGQAESLILSAVDADFWQLEFCLALLSIAAHRLEMASKLRFWQDDAIAAGAAQTVIQWLTSTAELEHSTAQSVFRVLRDAEVHWSSRLAAVAILLGRPKIDPIFTLQAHVDVLVFADWAGAAWVASPLCRAVAQAWKTACEQPVTLYRPAAGIPPLLHACNEPDESWGKVARMFLAATALVEVSVPEDIIRRAQRLADR
jgi:tetratricopeptide (TPR) repeat protein